MMPFSRILPHSPVRLMLGLTITLLSIGPSACASASAAAPPGAPETVVAHRPGDATRADDWANSPPLHREPLLAAPAPDSFEDVEAADPQSDVVDQYEPPAIINEAGQPEVLAPDEQTTRVPVLGDSEEERLDRDPSALSDFDPYLRDYGTWVEHPHYGTVWVPEERAVGTRFTPYVTRGHWSLTTEGDWIWVSDYPFGWVVFHYGKWIWTPDYGWAWIAGRRYAHAWVEFRTFSSPYAYVGWGPLPPRYIWRGGFAVAIGRYYPVPYVFCPYDYAFYPSVASYVIWERHRARRLIHRSRPHRRQVRNAAVASSPPVSHIPPRARPSGRVLPNPKAIAMARGGGRSELGTLDAIERRRLPATAPTTRRRVPMEAPSQSFQRNERRSTPSTQLPRRIERGSLPRAVSPTERRRSTRPLAPSVGADRAQTIRRTQPSTRQRLPPPTVREQRAARQREARQREAQQREARERPSRKAVPRVPPRRAAPPPPPRRAAPSPPPRRAAPPPPPKRVKPTKARPDRTAPEAARRRIEQSRERQGRSARPPAAVRKLPNRSRTVPTPPARRRKR